MRFRIILFFWLLAVLAANGVLVGCGDDDDDSGSVADDDADDDAADDADDDADDDTDDDADDDADDDLMAECDGAPTGNTVGIQNCSPDAQPGYTLFAPLYWTTTYLIDMQGRVVHQWESDYSPSNSVYLLEDGSLLRAEKHPDAVVTGGGYGGYITRYSWDGDIIWRVEYNGPDYVQHHDYALLPNGNVVAVAWEVKTKAEAVQAGRNPDDLEDDDLFVLHLVELDTSGAKDTPVWEWHLWDHVIQDFDNAQDNYGVVEDHPELVDMNFFDEPDSDWTHSNSVDYNEELDQLVVSVRHFSEAWVIDHSTTTVEAEGHSGGNSGKGGDLLYRWGNPQAYRAGTDADRKLYFQHDVHWIPDGLPGAGHLMAFNNGNQRSPVEYSSVDEWAPPVQPDGSYDMLGDAFGPADFTWSYIPDPLDFWFSNFISGAQRQPNGNTLICSGFDGHLFEVTPDGDWVWDYISPVTEDGITAQGDEIEPAESGRLNIVFRAYRYEADYVAFDGRDLTPGDPIEGD